MNRSSSGIHVSMRKKREKTTQKPPPTKKITKHLNFNITNDTYMSLDRAGLFILQNSTKHVKAFFP